MNTPLSGEGLQNFDPQKAFLLQPKRHIDTSAKVQHLLDNTETNDETLDILYVTDTLMEYFDFGKILKELSILFPDIYESHWNHILTNVDTLKNAIFSGGVECDESQMLTWYTNNGETDLKIVQDAVNLMLVEIIDTYQDHPIVGLAYMLHERHIPYSHQTKRPTTKYQEIFSSE